MKKVLISCSTHDALSYQERLSELSVDSIVSGEILDSQDYDGLLLPGGGDIAPFFYLGRYTNPGTFKYQPALF